MKVAKYLCVSVLVLFLCWRGIYPALTTIDTDFPNYYTSSKLFLEGTDLSRLYDDNWFAGEIRSHGMSLEGKFSPFPPPTFLLMLPVAPLSPASALRVWTAINLVGLIVVIALLSKIIHLDLLQTAIIVLLGGIGLANNFRFGQFYVILLLLIVAGYCFWTSGSPVFAGITFGIGASFKYFPVIYLLLFILRREWKGAFSLLATIAAINFICIAIGGIGMYRTYFSDVLVNHLSANMQNPFSATFQSWPSLFRRLFVYDPQLNPNPILMWSTGFVIATIAATGIILFSARRAILNLHRSSGPLALRLEFAILTIAVLAVLPASATYHYLLLILPVALLLQERPGESGLFVYLILALYIGLGFIPYHYFTTYDGQGILTLFAYPRLFIITVMVFMVIRLGTLNNPSSALPLKTKVS